MVVPDLRRITVLSAKRAAIALLLVSSLTTLLAASGCAKSSPTFVEHGATYTKSGALALLDRTDISTVAQHATSDATSLRHTALANLRRKSAAAAVAADLITKTLPSTARDVPVYVELGSFGKTPATIIVEATGPANGKLSTRRLWAIGSRGEVLFVATR
jgi:hypothetical protein